MTACYDAIGAEIKVTEKKVRCMRKKTRVEALNQLKNIRLKSLFFDGRDDKRKFSVCRKKRIIIF